MSGPRRHGSRFVAAACSFALLTLSILLLRDGVASAHVHPAKQHDHSSSASPAAGLLGGLGGLGTIVTKLGHTVDKVLTGVGSVLGDHPRATTTTPAQPPSSRPTNPSTPPRHTTPNTPAPHPTNSASASIPPGAVSHGSSPAEATRSSEQRTVRKASPAVAPVATSVSPHATRPVTSTSHVANALDTHSGSEIPGLDITAALAAMMLAMVLGVGLIVYRAGYRGVRTH